MPIGFYARFEPHTRSDDVEEGLAARVYDPAWTLSRQWQLGELLGDDGGSPVTARHVGRISRCTAYADRAGRRELPPDAGPVEAMAEAVPVTWPRWPRSLRVDVGRALLRCLRTAGLADRVHPFLTQFPLAPKDDLAAGRVPDGALAHRTLAPPLRATPPTLPNLPDLVVDQPLIDAALDWLQFCDALIPPPATAWDPARMEYDFTMEAPGVTLEAVEHGGGTLEWWAFDAEPAPSAGQEDAYDVTTVPTRVTFPGMPVPRWWQEEDAVIDLGAVEAHPADLARMAVLQFALLYGNDHFVVPVHMPVGAFFLTTHLLVTDVFGTTTLVPPSTGTAARWTMFTLSPIKESGVHGGFLLPATAVQPLVSAPVEEVLLLRDEMANLAWAIESTIEGPNGEPIHRTEHWHRPPENDPPDTGPPTYRFGTTVPPHWFPLVPQRDPSGDAPAFAVQQMADDPTSVPLGEFVAIGQTIADDRLPREGRRLIRDHMLARTSDGGTVVWSRRRSRIGRGEGSSGLSFDLAQ
ncbi:hypothetical protein AB0K60_16020 [Thermopolyspora sp. NPDC052614]|uniref:hypothetical protein n=1 Tax=Thermopolyspora sp. NPDC052614 TaxID=3155682 RepID=UPI0034365AFE